MFIELYSLLVNFIIHYKTAILIKKIYQSHFISEFDTASEFILQIIGALQESLIGVLPFLLQMTQVQCHQSEA